VKRFIGSWSKIHRLHKFALLSRNSSAADFTASVRKHALSS
jgi:hypothetical protein